MLGSQRLVELRDRLYCMHDFVLGGRAGALPRGSAHAGVIVPHRVSVRACR